MSQRRPRLAELDLLRVSSNPIDLNAGLEQAHYEPEPGRCRHKQSDLVHGKHSDRHTMETRFTTHSSTAHDEKTLGDFTIGQLRLLRVRVNVVGRMGTPISTAVLGPCDKCIKGPLFRPPNPYLTASTPSQGNAHFLHESLSMSNNPRYSHRSFFLSSFLPFFLSP